jgi:hypothetical protein
MVIVPGASKNKPAAEPSSVFASFEVSFPVVLV